MEACSGGRRVVFGLYCGRKLATLVEGSLVARFLGTLAESHPFGESRHSRVSSEFEGWVQDGRTLRKFFSGSGKLQGPVFCGNFCRTREFRRSVSSKLFAASAHGLGWPS